MNIYLIGFMGVGKSTVARQLSRRLQLPLTDTDEAMVSSYGCSVPEMFARWGEEGFRLRETKMLREISQGPSSVVSCGGGIALRQENVACMRENGRVIFLTASPQTILARVLHDENRPLLQGKKTIADISDLMEGRLPYYERAADSRIATDNRDISAICDEIIFSIDFTDNF